MFPVDIMGTENNPIRRIWIMSYDKAAEDRLSDLVCSFICHASGHLPDDVRKRLSEMAEIEDEGF